ncbi:phytoene/squalene synthase family protein [Candidatus Kryptobacter tengchongensis]|uniref:phytoene/squalene synthase family protein n=1 Tax=Kryptobacter tengchongensis TaxID=1643429 RepID=UPI000707E379|nr:phytoene/squalene synthase family protein [Candidatus Kryptobacter tengchongensis]CUS83130.1 Phytoene/squalene synthetase [Candidatus Kryptobacter tengchongensis]
MNYYEIYDRFSEKCSKIITNLYTTSFSIGIFLLDRKIRKDIYSIYGFVRLADEIVDTFHDKDKHKLLYEFKEQTYRAINEKFSLNPILNSFQKTVNKYKIDTELIEAFFKSMEMDLYISDYSKDILKNYIYGSAEVVGLMCLTVFTNGDSKLYYELKEHAIKLGSAFQKINFLRDIRYDNFILKRRYFNKLDLKTLDEKELKTIIDDIQDELRFALRGIQKLPKEAKLGVFVAYLYYYSLLKKIRKSPIEVLWRKRIRISNFRKILIALISIIKVKILRLQNL